MDIIAPSFCCTVDFDASACSACASTPSWRSISQFLSNFCSICLSCVILSALQRVALAPFITNNSLIVMEHFLNLRSWKCQTTLNDVHDQWSVSSNSPEPSILLSIRNLAVSFPSILYPAVSSPWNLVLACWSVGNPN